MTPRSSTRSRGECHPASSGLPDPLLTLALFGALGPARLAKKRRGKRPWGGGGTAPPRRRTIFVCAMLTTAFVLRIRSPGFWMTQRAPPHRRRLHPGSDHVRKWDFFFSFFFGRYHFALVGLHSAPLCPLSSSLVPAVLDLTTLLCPPPSLPSTHPPTPHAHLPSLAFPLGRVNSISAGMLEGDSYTDGACGPSGARVWLILGLCMSFGVC